MKNINLLILAFIFIVLASCQKDDIRPLNPKATDNVIDCKNCEGSWDLTKPIP